MTYARPTDDKTYIHKKIYTQKNDKSYLSEIQYYDGLGRPDQKHQHAITPDKEDLITLQEYDEYGRDYNIWSPALYAKNGGRYTQDILIKSQSVKLNNDANPYSQPIYELSPLNRIEKQYGPGQDWHANNKAIETQYFTNNNTDSQLKCLFFRISGDHLDAKLIWDGKTYNDGELFVTKIIDEDGNTASEFKNKLGQVILTRSNGYIDTYYVYDDFANLCYVLPPELSNNIYTTSVNNDHDKNMSEFAYIYKYDHRNRCIRKKLPGADYIDYVYDRADQLILSQDGEQREKGEWTYTIPDDFGRIALTGTCKND